jgi:polysaccharide deacetylase family protein (PEP-CTERM system associated)
MRNKFLFSVDLEDIRFSVYNGMKYRERIYENTYKYLDWLERHNAKATFFVVGNVASNYPDLIKIIIQKGHEIACHSYDHKTVDQHTEETFKRDLHDNIEALFKAGASTVKGYRAPVACLTKKTMWTYEIMHDLGLKYSSSVLPAKNPMYGWPTYYDDVQSNFIKGVYEIPITLGLKFPMKTLPIASGIYFRVFPFSLLKQQFKVAYEKQEPLVGYLHPYDIDTEQEYFMQPGLNNNHMFNILMYYNRKNVFKRLDWIIDAGFEIRTYYSYVKNTLVKGHV